MREHKLGWWLTLLTVATLVLSLQGEQMIDFVRNVQENDMVKKLRKLFTDYTAQLPEDRVYVQTDKPFYYPGETIWLTAYVRNGEDLKPSQTSEIVYVEWISPKGTTDKKLNLLTTDGVAQADISLDEDVPGGIYTLKAYTNWQKNDAENNIPEYIFKKEIQIQKVILPNLLMKLDFEKEAYNAGDEVKAFISFRTPKDIPLSNTPITYKVNIDGELFTENIARTDKDGKLTVNFTLPKDLTTNDATLNALVAYNGSKESISRAVPIVLNQMTAEFFPEGGDLIAGYSQKVAFRLLNEWNKPADGEGVITDDIGREVARFASYHQGVGAFEFIPQAGRKYTAKLTKPATSQSYPLPEVLPRGYAMQINQDSLTLFVKINSTEKEEVGLIAQMRGKIYYANSFALSGKTTVAAIPLKDLPAGVLQLTLFDAKNIARAERLAFVNRDKQLNITITTDKLVYAPREQVRMSLSVTDERGLPVPANLSLSVVNDKILSFADDKQGNILPKLLLEPDVVGEVFEPNFYFDRAEAKSIQALDYLMLTQGWRRFTWENITKQKPFQIAHKAEKQIVSGKVTDVNGRAIGGIRVQSDDSKISITTDKEGNYTLTRVQLYEPIRLKASQGELSGEITVYSYGAQSNLVLRRPYRPLPARALMANEGEAPAGMMKKGGRKNKAAVLEDDNQLLGVEDMGFAGAGMGGDEVFDMDMDDAAMSPPATEPEEVIVMPQVVESRVPMPIVAPKMAERKEAVMDWKEDVRGEVAIEQVAYYRAREFSAPVYSKQEKTTLRTDFRQTIFWKGNITFDKKGKAEVTFYNSDEVTTFRATAEGVGIEGSVGHTQMTYTTLLPFSMSAKVPVEMTFGDRVEIPVLLTNNTDKNLEGELYMDFPQALVPIINLEVATAPDFLNPSAKPKFQTYLMRTSIPANKAITIDIPCMIGSFAGKDTMKIRFVSKNAQDAFSQPITFVPRGFPTSIAVAGKEMSQKFSFEITNPVEGSLQANLTAYPTSLSDLLAGIESIIREPYGCFEQTSSATYPNIMVLRYLQEAEIDNPKAKAEALAKIETGYKRLVAYETPEKGYEWFGGVPAHEALTAYGLLEFTDMKYVYSGVNSEMMQRTSNWLFSRKDGVGGFKRDGKALDDFGRANDEVTNAYIVWSLSEAGYVQEIARELENSYQVALKGKDDYITGLVANALFNVKDKRAEPFLKTWLMAQKQDGSFTNALHSVTVTTGKGLAVETTSLAVLAMLKSSAIPHKCVEAATKFIVAQRSPYGGFGNTQTTIMALKALTAFAKYAKRTPEGGELEFYLEGKLVGKARFEAGRQEAIRIEGIAKHLNKGKYKAEIRFVGCKQPLPYTFALTYSSELPQSSQACKVAIQTSLAEKTVKVGETVRLTTTLQNKQKEGLPMTLAIVGLPAGTSAQPWQLKELQEKKIIDFYEIIGNSVIFYYRQMRPEEKRTIHLDLKAEIKGTYTAAASSAYLYYTTERKSWQEGVAITIQE